MARNLQTKLIRAQSLTFADWCADVRDLAGVRWPEVADQCATLYAVWCGGATPAQALHMVHGEPDLAAQSGGIRRPPRAAVGPRRTW
jgi:hypothetical protein